LCFAANNAISPTARILRPPQTMRMRIRCHGFRLFFEMAWSSIACVASTGVSVVQGHAENGMPGFTFQRIGRVRFDDAAADTQTYPVPARLVE